jgi:heme-degrading monooxygenase HmoA
MIVVNGPVVLINAFEVPAGEDEAFLEAWERQRAFLSSHDGFISTKLHRSLTPDTDFRFINMALWESTEAFAKATSQPEFKESRFPYRFHASLYEVAREDTP